MCYIPGVTEGLVAAGMSTTMAGATSGAILAGGAGLAVKSAGQGGKTESAQKKYQAELSRQHAQMGELQAKNIEKLGKYHLNKQAEKHARDTGAAIARFGSSNLALTGSPTEFLSSMAEEQYSAQRLLKYDFDTKAYNARIGVFDKMAEANMYDFAAKSSAAAGKLNVANALYSSGLKMAGSYNSYRGEEENLKKIAADYKEKAAKRASVEQVSIP